MRRFLANVRTVAGGRDKMFGFGFDDPELPDEHLQPSAAGVLKSRRGSVASVRADACTLRAVARKRCSRLDVRRLKRA